MNLKKELEKARRQGYAIGQFNVYNLEALEAVAEASLKWRSPAIIGISGRGAKFMGIEEICAIVDVYRQRKIPVFLNLDHAKDWDMIKKAIDFGFDCVHFDGSKLSPEENIETAKKIVKLAKKKGVIIEGEIETIGDSILTDVPSASKFVKETKVDSLAVNIGSLHGIMREGVNPDLNIERLKDLSKNLDVFLVLHGGSGTKEADIKKAIEFGISKVNINTDLKLAYAKELRESIKDVEDKNVVYEYVPRVKKVIFEEVSKKIKLFNSLDRI
jgi:fructose-bisphosphate aldolase class II